MIDKVIDFITNKVKKIAGKLLGKDKDKAKDKDKHKEKAEDTKKDFEKDKGDDKTTDVDRKEHERIGKEIKKKLEAPITKKETEAKKFYDEKSRLARDLEKEYQPSLKNSNRLKISFDNLQKVEEDHEFDFHIQITANNFDIYGDAKFHDLLLPESLLIGDSIKYTASPGAYGINLNDIYIITKVENPNVVFKGTEEKYISLPVESFIQHYKKGLVSEVAPNENKEVVKRCLEIIENIDIETIRVPISGDAPRIEADMRTRYESLFTRYDTIKKKISKRPEILTSEDLTAIKEIKKNVDVLKQIIETRLVTGLNDPKEGLGNSNFAYGFYSIKVDDQIVDASNFATISSKYNPVKTSQKIEWSKIGFMTEVPKNMKLIFSPVRTSGDPGYGKDSSQDAERKLVAYIYDVVISTITGIAREKLNNPQQFPDKKRSEAELEGKERVSGEVHIFTEMPPCSACDNAISKLKGMFPHLSVNVQYGVYYDKSK
ncbi:MAG: hypothetical protein J7604_11480 [Sporocytophaga sp.]|uniref:hypothetical protein n=1 Tax=Sporocytophaga sp. TaxID=2231183 RepID=UPI001B1DB1FE|nr:hypothetical protein [Sporocytophaga sp.]MBO9700822.1 hypothetical protein [Sporocytophaga sp.]